MSYTKEPWAAVGSKIESLSELLEVGKCYTTHQLQQSEKSGAANAKRIVACVNACEGMAYPVEELAKMRAEIATLRAALNKAHELLGNGGRS